MIFFINFCSRVEKVKFKVDYKLYFNQQICFLQFNCLLSYLLYFIILLIFGCCIKKKNKNQVDNNNNQDSNNQNNSEDNKDKINESLEKSDYFLLREKFILILILCENVLMFIFSLINYFEKNAVVSYCSIFISGSFNFLLYDYFSFSTRQGEYLTLSGIISLAQFFFRSVEFFVPSFDENYWYLLQLIPCSIGAILCFTYLRFIGCFKFIDTIKRWCCKKDSDENKSIDKIDENPSNTKVDDTSIN